MENGKKDENIYVISYGYLSRLGGNIDGIKQNLKTNILDEYINALHKKMLDSKVFYCFKIKEK